MTEPRTPGEEPPEDETSTTDEQSRSPEESSEPDASPAEAGEDQVTDDVTDDTEADQDGDIAHETDAEADDSDQSETDTARVDEESTVPDPEDNDEALSEEEQLEIAEAALREAETGGYGEEAPEKTADDDADEVAETDDAGNGDGPIVEEPAADEIGKAPAPLAPPPQKEVVIEKRGGVLAGLLGGAIAVVGAVFAAPYVLPENMRPVMSLETVEAKIAEHSEQLTAQSGEIGAFAGAVGELSARIDDVATTAETAVTPDVISGLEDRLASIQTDVTAQNEALGARIEEIAVELVELQRSPLEDSTDPAVIAALAAYGRELQLLREEVAAQTEENQRVIEEAAEATAEARALAEAEQAAAAERAAVAAGQQAIVDIKSALDSGAPFADALANVSGEVPEALSAASETGVATLAALQVAYAGPARAALDAARRSDVGDNAAERGMSFLQTQLGMRSLAPRDGEGADAILSRAEAATRSGDLATAVTELQALPESALAEMQDWISQASARAEAVAAADALAQSLATN